MLAKRLHSRVGDWFVNAPGANLCSERPIGRARRQVRVGPVFGGTHEARRNGYCRAHSCRETAPGYHSPCIVAFLVHAGCSWPATPEGVSICDGLLAVAVLLVGEQPRE